MTTLFTEEREIQNEAPWKLTFYLKLWSGTFDLSSYHPSQTEDRVSSKHIEEVLTEFHTIIQQKLDSLKHLNLISFFILAGLIYSMIRFVDLINPYFSFGCFFVLILCYCGFSIGFDRRICKAQEIIDQKVSLYNESLKHLQVRWSLPTYFPDYVELYNDFRSSSPNRPTDSQSISLQIELSEYPHNMVTCSTQPETPRTDRDR